MRPVAEKVALCLTVLMASIVPIDQFGVCMTAACRRAAKEIIKFMNQGEDPCNDFYIFACGRFGQEGFGDFVKLKSSEGVDEVVRWRSVLKIRNLVDNVVVRRKYKSKVMAIFFDKMRMMNSCGEGWRPKCLEDSEKLIEAHMRAALRLFDDHVSAKMKSDFKAIAQIMLEKSLKARVPWHRESPDEGFTELVSNFRIITELPNALKNDQLMDMVHNPPLMNITDAEKLIQLPPIGPSMFLRLTGESWPLNSIRAGHNQICECN